MSVPIAMAKHHGGNKRHKSKSRSRSGKRGGKSRSRSRSKSKKDKKHKKKHGGDDDDDDGGGKKDKVAITNVNPAKPNTANLSESKKKELGLLSSITDTLGLRRRKRAVFDSSFF